MDPVVEETNMAARPVLAVASLSVSGLSEGLSEHLVDVKCMFV